MTEPQSSQYPALALVARILTQAMDGCDGHVPLHLVEQARNVCYTQAEMIEQGLLGVERDGAEFPIAGEAA